MQGLFVSIWHNGKLSIFSCIGNWTCFWFPCGTIFLFRCDYPFNWSLYFFQLNWMALLLLLLYCIPSAIYLWSLFFHIIWSLLYLIIKTMGHYYILVQMKDPCDHILWAKVFLFMVEAASRCRVCSTCHVVIFYCTAVNVTWYKISSIDALVSLLAYR